MKSRDIETQKKNNFVDHFVDQVRDECVPRASSAAAAAAAAPSLRPYKPRGANELFFMPHVEADASSSCTTMESSHTGKLCLEYCIIFIKKYHKNANELL